MTTKYIVSAYYDDERELIFLITSDLSTAKERARKMYKRNMNTTLQTIKTDHPDMDYGEGAVGKLYELGELGLDNINF